MGKHHDNYFCEVDVTGLHVDLHDGPAKGSFSSAHELNQYLKKKCIKERNLNNIEKSNQAYMYLFWLLLLILLIYAMMQLMSNNTVTPVSRFGSFNF